jgi:hypothetical protein
MSWDLFIAELLFLIIGGGSLLLSLDFYYSKNGRLRKLLMWFFFSQFWVVSISGVYYFFTEKGFSFPIEFGVVRIIALTPMAIIMLLIRKYVRESKSKNKN